MQMRNAIRAWGAAAGLAAAAGPVAAQPGAPAVAELLEAVRGASESMCALALQGLRNGAGPAADGGFGTREVELLREGLASGDPCVRRVAAWLLAGGGGTAGADVLEAALRSPAGEVRGEAAAGLAWAGDARRVGPLAEMLAGDADPRVRRSAAWALARFRVPAAWEALARALGGERDESVREMAAWALAQTPGAGGAAPLSAALRGDASARVRATVAWGLGNAYVTAAVADLEAALGDPAPEVRQRAAWALGHLGPRAAPAGLVRALNDDDGEVRLLAAWALGQMGDPSAVAPLRAARTPQADARLRYMLARAVVLARDAPQDALAEVLRDPDPEVRRMAAYALATNPPSWVWPWPWADARNGP